MQCQACSAENQPGNKFCIKCGAPLQAASPQPMPPAPQPQPAPVQVPVKPEAPANRDLLVNNITPADGETSVRSYYCTYYKSRLLGLEAAGYLGVTNKRVLFQAKGSSRGGNSVIQSEVPIVDVSGITSYKGTFFSFGHLLLGFLASAAGSILAAGVAAAVLGEGGDLEVLGYIFGILIFGASFLAAKTSIWKPTAVSISSMFFTMAGGSSLVAGLVPFVGSYGGGSDNMIFPMLLSFAASIYALILIFIYATRPTFSLAINSKGGSSTPINISGASGIGFLNVSAGRALTAAPARDSEVMLKELGAVIMDIQTLGDLGISKWKIS